MSFGIVLYVLIYLLINPTLISSVSPPPVHCDSHGCTVSYPQRIWVDRTPCNASKVIYPTTEQELLSAVADAVKHKLKIKVVSKGSHSSTKLVCPAGNDGVLISTRDYNSRIHVNETAMTATADAGVQLRDFLDRIAESGLALPYTPVWDGISVAGLVSTGSHGSGLWGKGSASHEHVVSMRLVIPATAELGYAKVIEVTADRDENELNAARVSLGVLGAISQLTFALEPIFKTSVTLQLRDDTELENEIEDFAKAHEFGSISWYPSLNKALYKLEDRVSVDTEGNGVYKLTTLDLMEVSVLESNRAAGKLLFPFLSACFKRTKLSVHVLQEERDLILRRVYAEEAVEATRNADVVCELSKAILDKRLSSADGLLNDGSTFQQFPVVGFSHRMQTSGACLRNVGNEDHDIPVLTATGFEYSSECLESNSRTCMWDPRIRGAFFFITAISIPVLRVKEAIRDIKNLHEAQPQALCILEFYGGIWMRFIRKSSAFLGEREDAVVFEFYYYRSREANTPRLQEDVIEEIEQLLLMKYGGKPHWGKNRDLAFEGMEERTLDLPGFVLVKDRFDPQGVFSSEWSDAILGIKPNSQEMRGVQIFRDYCALEGLCICSQDRHCAPEQGYFCKPGRVFEKARVCSYEGVKLVHGGEQEEGVSSSM